MYTDELSGEELADVVGAACLTNDMLELLRAQTLDNATAQTLVEFSGAFGRQPRVQNLA